MELALEAAETGHLVLSTMTTMTPEKAVERILGSFPAAEQSTVKERLGRMLRAIVSQRLVPRRDGERMAVFEIVDGQSPELALHSENGVRTPGKKNSARIDIELEHLVRSGSITPEVALAQAVDRVLLSAKLSPPSKPRLR